MAEITGIAWTDSTWNPWIGCTKVAPGCAHCYAEADMDRRRGRVKWGPAGTRSRTSDAYWRQPLAWEKQAAAEGTRRRVFCASLADVFEDWQGPILDARGQALCCDGGVPVPPWRRCGYRANGPGRPVSMDHLREDLFALIARTPHLDWLLLTKRPANVLRMWPRVGRGDQWLERPGDLGEYVRFDNVWLGTSISDQATADAGAPPLLACAGLCRVLFLSVEPLLGPLVLHKHFAECQCGRGHGFTVCPNTGGVASTCAGSGCTSLRPKLRWVIVGGESGPHARPCDLDWVRALVGECRAAAVPCFVKQMGSVARDGNRRTGPCDAEEGTFPRCWRCGHWDFGPCGDGTLLCNGCDAAWERFRDPKGGDPAEWPADLRVRQFPGQT